MEPKAVRELLAVLREQGVQSFKRKRNGDLEVAFWPPIVTQPVPASAPTEQERVLANLVDLSKRQRAGS
jgi:hypothetical protein